jgi:hypothetical protein
MSAVRSNAAWSLGALIRHDPLVARQPARRHRGLTARLGTFDAAREGQAELQVAMRS